MIFNQETPKSWHKKNAALVAKWELSFRDKKDLLRPQWEYECKWHQWFAWYAVTIGTYEKPQTAWMCWVERRIKYRGEMPTRAASWSLRTFEYRLPNAK